MSHLHSVPVKITITTAGTDVDLFSFLPNDDKPITLRGFRLSQLSEIGEVQEENLEITIYRMAATVTVGSGGAAVTARTPPGDSGDPVWGFSCRANDTTVATTSGSTTLYDTLAWNVRNTPYEVWYPDKPFCLKARQGEAIILRCETIVADSIDFIITAWVEEE